jgi:cytochrome c
VKPSAIWRYAHRAATIALLCAAYSGPADAQQLTVLERQGQVLLTKFCSACHAVNRSGASPHFRAPPFRVISQRYDVADLVEQLREGFAAPHPDMPTFKFSRQGARAAQAYLNAIQQ